MSLITLKPFLIVVLIGLLGICTASLFNDGSTPFTLSLLASFEDQVDACLAENPGWGRRICERIARGDIWIGMSEEMILASRGEPRSVERPLGEDSTCENWTYQTARFGLVILEFEDGILTAWGLAHPDCPACQVSRPDE